MNVYDRIGLLEGDARPGYLYVVIKGPETVELRVSKKVKLTQKIEVGNEEFIYKKGPKGLVAHLALLLGIPEKRVKVVGLGAMKAGEVYGEHFGINSTSFLQWTQHAGEVKSAKFVIDSRDGEDVQALEEAEAELP